MAYGELHTGYNGPRKSKFGIVGQYYPNLTEDGMVIRKGTHGPKEQRPRADGTPFTETLYVAESPLGHRYAARTAKGLGELVGVPAPFVYDYIKRGTTLSRGRLAGYKFYKESKSDETATDQTGRSA